MFSIDFITVSVHLVLTARKLHTILGIFHTHILCQNRNPSAEALNKLQESMLCVHVQAGRHGGDRVHPWEGVLSSEQLGAQRSAVLCGGRARRGQVKGACEVP